MLMSSSVAGAATIPCLNAEPALEELFADPIIQKLMRSDGVSALEVRKLLQKRAGSRRFRA